MASALALTLLAVCWLAFAPRQLGGTASYAVIEGFSMEPHLHRGDLVILHPQSDYAVGEVVAYHNAELGRPVLHRIVGRESLHYVFKGDNNDFRDGSPPVRSELIGKLWIRIPRAGCARRARSGPVGLQLGGLVVSVAVGEIV